MTNTLIQFRVDEKLKNEASKIYEDLGLDSMHLNISNDLDEKDEIYNAIMEKYESIN